MAKTVHELKTEFIFFDAIVTGHKNFEIRFNDRNFKQHDGLKLREIYEGSYTGYVITCEISYILENYAGLQDGYVILGLKNIQLNSLAPRIYRRFQ